MGPLSSPLFQKERGKRANIDWLFGGDIFQAMTSRGGSMPCTQDTSPLSHVHCLHACVCTCTLGRLVLTALYTLQNGKTNTNGTHTHTLMHEAIAVI